MYDFGRKIRLNVSNDTESLSIENLRIDFDMSKNSESNSNKSTVMVYNLNETTRQSIADSKELTLYVGYESSDTEYLYLFGDIAEVFIAPDGLDVITTIEIEEGKVALEEATFVKSYSAGTSRKKIIKDAFNTLPDELQIDDSIIDKVLGAIDSFDEALENGSTFFQKTKEFLDDFFKLAGISYSVQDGQMVLLAPEQTLGNDVYYINSSNGLIGNPTKTTEGCDIQTMLLPELKIGTKIVLESKYIKGNFKVTEFNANGSNYTNEWGLNIKTKELK